MDRVGLARLVGQFLFIVWAVLLVLLVLLAVVFAFGLFVDPHTRRSFPVGFFLLMAAFLSAGYGLRGVLLAPEVVSLQRRVAAGSEGAISRLASQLGPRGGDVASVRGGGVIYLALAGVALVLGILGLLA